MSEFIFSLDYELGLGEVTSQSGRNAKQDIFQEKKAISKLLKLAKQESVPLTFAVPGHLFLDKCNGHPALKNSFGKKFENIFNQDPKTSKDKNDLWYAPDSIDEILSDGHEIASHSFMHVSYSLISKEAAELDLKACIAAAKERNILLKSFIFPRNEIKHLELLNNFGFTHFASSPKPTNFLINYRSFSLAFPKKNTVSNIIDIPRTYYFHSSKSREAFKLSAIATLASSKNALLHFWCHPWNLSSSEHFRIIEKLFRKINVLGFEKKRMCEIKI